MKNIHASFGGMLWLALFSASPAFAISPDQLPKAVSPNYSPEADSPQSATTTAQFRSIPRSLLESGMPERILTPEFSAAASVSVASVPVAPAAAPPIYRVSPKVGARFTTTGSGTDPFVGIEGFTPLDQKLGRNLTYLEGRLQISTDNGALGGNVLLGHRSLSKSQRSLVGTYVSYDIRNTGNTTFSQLGAGFESLSERLDLRSNIYLPIGKQRDEVGAITTSNVRFQGNQIGVDRFGLVQEALPGFDLEVGTKLAKLGQGSLRGYVGGYYYKGDEANFVGFRTRLVARPTDSVTAGLTLQSDTRFDTRLIFNVGVSFPSQGSTQRNAQPPAVLARLGESPERQQSILVDEFFEPGFQAALNPATGQPWNLQFVTLGTGTGTGTFEAPAGTIATVLPNTQSGSLVYVEAAGSNPGIPGFTIPNGVSVVSSAIAQTIPTQYGNLPLPNSGNGNRPRITGSVTLGNDTQLVGFNIDNSSGNAIQGTNIRNVSIKANQISNPTQSGVALNNVTGTVGIFDNTINRTNLISDDGIRLENTTGSTIATIQGNTISNIGGAGVIARMLGSAQGTVTIDRNSIAQSGSGIFVATVDNGQLTSRMTNNTLSDNSQGISSFAFDRSQHTALIDGNQLSNQSIFAANSETSRLQATISNNRVTGNSTITIPGIIYAGRGNAIATVSMLSNQVSGFTNLDSSGIQASLFDNVVATVRIANNASSGNIRGIITSANSASQLKTIIENNTTTGNLLEGTLVAGSSVTGTIGTGTPQINALVQNNQSTGNNTTNQGFGDFAAATFSPGARICLRLASNQVGVLTLADQTAPPPFNGFSPFNAPPFTIPPLSFLGGQVSVELPVQYDPATNSLTNFGGNTIAVVNPATQVVWTGTSDPAGSCQVP